MKQLRHAIGALAASVLVLLVGCAPEKVAPPASYTKYSAADQAFRCLAPAGWHTQSTSAQATMSSAVFTRGPAKIDITADLQGALLGDIAKSGSGMAQGLVPGVEMQKQKPP